MDTDARDQVVQAALPDLGVALTADGSVPADDDDPTLEPLKGQLDIFGGEVV